MPTPVNQKRGELPPRTVKASESFVKSQAPQGSTGKSHSTSSPQSALSTSSGRTLSRELTEARRKVDAFSQDYAKKASTKNSTQKATDALRQAVSGHKDDQFRNINTTRKAIDDIQGRLAQGRINDTQARQEITRTMESFEKERARVEGWQNNLNTAGKMVTDLAIESAAMASAASVLAAGTASTGGIGFVPSLLAAGAAYAGVKQIGKQAVIENVRANGAQSSRDSLVNIISDAAYGRDKVNIDKRLKAETLSVATDVVTGGVGAGAGKIAAKSIGALVPEGKALLPRFIESYVQGIAEGTTDGVKSYAEKGDLGEALKTTISTTILSTATNFGLSSALSGVGKLLEAKKPIMPDVLVPEPPTKRILEAHKPKNDPLRRADPVEANEGAKALAPLATKLDYIGSPDELAYRGERVVHLYNKKFIDNFAKASPADHAALRQNVWNAIDLIKKGDYENASLMLGNGEIYRKFGIVFVDGRVAIPQARHLNDAKHVMESIVETARVSEFTMHKGSPHINAPTHFNEKFYELGAFLGRPLTEQERTHIREWNRASVNIRLEEVLHAMQHIYGGPISKWGQNWLENTGKVVNLEHDVAAVMLETGIKPQSTWLDLYGRNRVFDNIDFMEP